MALIKGKRGEIPPDAIILTEKEAFEYQVKTLNNWPHLSDVWAYKLGRYILGVAAGATGFYFNTHFRRKFKLLHYGSLASLLPLCFVPSGIAMIIYTESVTRKIILRHDICPVCMEMRASAFQAMIGCVFPLLLAPISCLALQSRFPTYQKLPSIKEPLKVFNTVIQMAQPIKNVVLGLFIGHALLAAIITQMEVKNIDKVQQKLLLKEKEDLML